MLWVLITVIALIAISYVLFIRPYKYWSARGVKQGQPAFPLGDNWDLFLRKLSPPEMIQKFYDHSPNSRYFGIYQFLTPTLLIRDPDLIKQITVKDFDHFLNHRAFTPEDSDPLMNKTLFALKDEKWRDMRTTLSPAFTSSKMKFLFSVMSETGAQFVEFFLKQNKDFITLEMKDTLSRFTNDVIAGSVFGIKCDSLKDKNNEFYLIGKEASDFTTFWRTVKLAGNLVMPMIYKLFKVTLFSKSVEVFFNRIVKENINLREAQKIVRPDMMHLLLQARKTNSKKEEKHEIPDNGFETVEEFNLGGNSHAKQDVSDEDVIAQAFVFFFAGFDSVSSVMCFMCYELALNSDIQQKLLNEIDKVREDCDGKLTYEALTEMKFLDMVVLETLRKWPNNPFQDRVCSKPYTIQPEGPGEKPLYLHKGTLVLLPVYGLQRDPKYFPNPERFDPERFSDENKHKIKPCTFIPFGSGPRICIGSRFALLEIKVLFFYVLSHFEVVPVQKTEIPIKLRKSGFTTNAQNEIWLGLKPRVK